MIFAKGFQFCSPVSAEAVHIVPPFHSVSAEYFFFLHHAFFFSLFILSRRELSVVIDFARAELPVLREEDFNLPRTDPLWFSDSLSSVTEVLQGLPHVTSSTWLRHDLDLSLPIHSVLLAPAVVATSFLEDEAKKLFAPAALPAMSWEVTLERDDQDRGLFGTVAAPPLCWELDASADSFVVPCPVPPRLLSRSVKLAWEAATLPALEDVALREQPLLVDSVPVWNEELREPFAWDEMREPAPPFAEIPHRNALPVSCLLGSDLSSLWQPKAYPACPYVEQLCVPLPDSVMLPGDLECPGVSMVIAMPPHLVVDAPLLSCSFLSLQEPQRCSLVTLELKMSSATLPVVAVVTSDEKPFFRFHLPEEKKEGAEFDVIPQCVIPRAVPPIVTPQTFADHISVMDDDQFIACAKAETQRLIGYQDNGRGDIHHFLAMCAEFASHKHLFESIVEAAPPPAASAVVVPVISSSSSSSALRPLSKRGRKEPAQTVAAEELKRPKKVAAFASALPPAENLLNSFMKTRGVETKKTWTLQGFAQGDDAASNKIVDLLGGGRKSVIRFTSSSPSKSLLSVCLLVAAKEASTDCAVVCVHEHLHVARQHLALHAGVFSGVSFGDRIKPVNVALLDALPERLPVGKVLILACGSDAFCRAIGQRVVSHSMVCAVVGPCDDGSQFDLTLSGTNRIDFRAISLSDSHRAHVEAVEAVVAELASSLISPTPPVQLLSAESILRVMEGSSDPQLLLLRIGKMTADWVGSHSVGQALAFLESCFGHPVYGSLARGYFSSLADSWMFSGGQNSCHVKRPDLEVLLDELNKEPVLVMIESWVGNESRWPHAKAVSAARALEDALFPWNSFRRAIVVDNLGRWEAAEALEMLRVKSPGCAVSWFLTDYEMTRSGAHLFWSTLPTAARVCAAFDLAFDWKRFLALQPEGLEDAIVVASKEMLLTSPNLMSSLSSSLGLTLMLRAGMAADLVLDEARCVLVRALQGISFEELCASV
jgi:hypothetical protein